MKASMDGSWRGGEKVIINDQEIIESQSIKYLNVTNVRGV